MWGLPYSSTDSHLIILVLSSGFFFSASLKLSFPGASWDI